MKQWLSIVLSVALLFSLCACKESSSYEGTAEEFETIIGGIARIPIATMGVSMIITAQTVDLLDWCEASSFTDEQLAADVKAYYDALDTEAQELFLEQAAVMVNCVGSLSRDESRANLLEAAGVDKKRTWDEETLSLAASIDDLLP